MSGATGNFISDDSGIGIGDKLPDTTSKEDVLIILALSDEALTLATEMIEKIPNTWSLLYHNGLMPEILGFIKQYGLQERIDDFTRMRDYYDRGNIKLWDEPDNNHNSVYLDDHIAELTALKAKGGE